MTTEREALKLALEALGHSIELTPDVSLIVRCREAIAAIRSALAEQPAQQQEPEIWEGDRAYNEGRSEYEISVHGFRFGKHRDFWELTSIQQAEWVAKAAKRLYTSQPQRKPLTDEQLVVMRRQTDKGSHAPRASDLAFARAIEAAHGIKEQA